MELLLLVLALLVLLDFAALRWGVDSRDGFTSARSDRSTATPPRRAGLFPTRTDNDLTDE